MAAMTAASDSAEAPASKPQDDVTAKILAAVRRAPAVPADEREAMRALLGEVKSDPRSWLTSAELTARLAALPDNGDDIDE